MSHKYLNYLLVIARNQDYQVDHMDRKNDLSGSKPIKITTSNAFTKKQTMVVKVIKTNIAVFAMIHVWLHINIAFNTEVSQCEDMAIRVDFLHPSLPDVFVLFAIYHGCYFLFGVYLRVN